MIRDEHGFVENDNQFLLSNALSVPQVNQRLLYLTKTPKVKSISLVVVTSKMGDIANT
jgi:hypothetical protein